MTTALVKSCLCDSPRVCFSNVYRFVSASVNFGFEDGIWDLIIIVPDLCLSSYFPFLIAS